MRLALATAPAEEPISLAEAKLYLRIGSTAEDALISGLIGAAREMCEARVSRSFVATDWDLHLDEWPRLDGPARYLLPAVTLPVAPVSAVASVQYYDADNALQTLDPTRYDVSLGSPGRVSLARSQCWPTIACRTDAIVIRFTAGYGAATAVPYAVKAAISLALVHLYENRGEEDVEMPCTVAALLDSVYYGPYA